MDAIFPLCCVITGRFKILLNVVTMEIVLSNTWKHHLRIWPIFQGNNFNVLSEVKVGGGCLDWRCKELVIYPSDLKNTVNADQP